MKLKNSKGVRRFIDQFDNPNDRWKNGNPGWKVGHVPPTKGKTFKEIYGEEKANKRLNAIRTKRIQHVIPPHTPSVKKRLSEVAKARGLGGYVKGSGRGKKGWYAGYWCDSSYELAWIIYQLDHNQPFIRNTTKFPYELDGIVKNWLPDFSLPDGTYVEIKGYVNDAVQAKLAAFPHPIQLLTKELLHTEFEYVINTYGKNFTDLYHTDS